MKLVTILEYAKMYSYLEKSFWTRIQIPDNIKIVITIEGGCIYICKDKLPILATPSKVVKELKKTYKLHNIVSLYFEGFDNGLKPKMYFPRNITKLQNAFEMVLKTSGQMANIALEYNIDKLKSL